ncbi:DctP family TRAP transporter solute-binding subunit [Blastococcus saxobsidens]|uniref:Tripartite ATP-independent transporter DctP family solute receptor n=1 Tax=Blastococcus saxobsidens TaxID=138336 RepID=A0A4V2G272_9ACTN|nr:DctP family TRAP transporter solute-binding subunit [Blastococcus saxobsidens]RZU31976.1 tripartite ATP-independent transporter DctP family solute receptor [Blastococcus saxobsidens]
MKTRSRRRRIALASSMALPLLLAAACGGSDDGGGGGGGSANEEITLDLAHSYTDDQPQSRCGAQVIAEEVAAADVGVTVEIFGSSQLGGDADRVQAVVAGDHDIDIQGASALGAVHEPIGVVDAAYAFDDAQHLADFFAGDASADLKQSFTDATGVQILGAWSAGARHFTANKEIREPADLQGVRMRFPNSPQFLMNAEALGATPTEVAFEELYLALQQGIVEGQENPITNIVSQNFAEVQDYISLSGHQQNSNLVIIGPVWEELSDEQQEALSDAVASAVEQVPACVEELEQQQLDEWAAGGDFQVVDDVDVDAFQEQAEEYFTENYSGEQLEVYEAIRNAAE